MMDTLRAGLRSLTGYRSRSTIQPYTRVEWMAEDITHRYDVLRAYYHANNLYQDVAAHLYDAGIWTEGMAALRNPAHRVGEFYAARLWPGTLPDALPIETDNAALLDPIQQVWAWSNWGAQKQVAARTLAVYGDLFIKVVSRPATATSPPRAYFQLVDPWYVRDFDSDERGFLTWCRIDVPQTRRNARGKLESYTLTEVWSKVDENGGGGTFRRWEHTQGSRADLLQLGTPVEDVPLSTFGVDFVPIVHVKFRDTGEHRGAGAFSHALDKIDEANRVVTRLHQMLFRYNKALWALRANGMDAQGRPLPPPMVAGRTDTDASNNGTLTLGDDRWVNLPGTAELQALVPSIDYAAALSILQDHMGELAQDLPELRYYALAQMSNPSGRAVRLLLADAIDKVVEARGNAESGLIRADMMALTIGQAMGLPGFEAIGAFDAGDFDHRFRERDVLPADALEDAQAEYTRAQAAAMYTNAGVPVARALRRVEWSEQEADEVQQAAALMGPNVAELAMQAFERGEGA